MSNIEKHMSINCPCGSGNLYKSCCGLYIDQQHLPKTPEQLMRSRYTAYSLANIEYISKTMQGPAALLFDPVSAKEWAQKAQWLKLEVLNSKCDPQNSKKGFVEFRAHYRLDHQEHCIHELSEFQLQDEQWYYVDGKSVQQNAIKSKINRNDPCLCGSGKKYKKCCGQS